MEPGGVGTRGLCLLCLAVLCSGAARDFQAEEPGNHSIPQHEDTLEPTGDPLDTPGPTTTSREVATTTTWPKDTTSPPWMGEPPSTPPPAGATGNQTQTTAAVPVRYWSPVVFVVLALLVLFFTYNRKRGEGSRDQAVTASDSSDLGALDHVAAHDTTPIIPAPQGDRKESEPPPAPDHTETTFCEQPPAPAQPSSPPAAD